ncbi:MAG TPA: DUF4136 domain-containing protein [Vicinamibacterales bacterium]|nr:DUF4136 domain-containing protein [Vicinamibacterales bacterium]
MRIRMWCAFLVAILLFTTSAWAVLLVDYDRRVNFSRYKTYSWGVVMTGDTMWDQRLKDAVDGALAAKGLTQVPSGGDVVVNSLVILRAEHSAQTFASGDFHQPWGWGGLGPWFGTGFGSATTSTSSYPVGTLLIHLTDGASKALLWRGLADGNVSSNPDKAIKKLNDNVRKMFKDFPPRSTAR